MKPIPKLLSKTKLLRGYRCPKCIYLTIQKPQLEASITPELQALFDQGTQVGIEARKFFPAGELIDNLPWDFVGALSKTRELIEAKTNIIYEAAFEYRGCYARADIIQYNEDSKKWSIYEVKSSTKVKPEHLDDAGLQAWIMAKSGIALEKIHVMHINPECRFPHLNDLFKIQEITEEVRQRYLQIQPKINEIFTTLRSTQVPDIDIGPYCLAPTECGFREHCWAEKKVPALSVFNLPGIRERKWELYNQGIISLDDPRLTDLSEQQQRMVTAFKTGERWLEPQAIQDALATWKFPLIFLDFETINPAIPRYEGCGPFQQVPFQFSVHLWPHPEAELSHQAFLYDLPDDPRPMLIPALLEACGQEGSIVSYYAPFEGERIKELAAYSPAHHERLHSLVDRLVDPLPLIREHVYDNAFSGSFSLKNVAPALLGKEHGYDGMLVAKGGDAQRAFEEMIGPRSSRERKAILRQALLDYCMKDTLVMVELVKWLYQQR